MKLSDFDFELPDHLIAQAPLEQRSGSRLLVVGEHDLRDDTVAGLPDLLQAGDLLVCNDTQVINARLRATKDSGGQAEILIERILDEHCVLAQVRVSKPLKPGRFLALEADETNTDLAPMLVMVCEREGEFYELEFPQPVLEVLARYGSVPLPPYIQRAPDAADNERYQTVFAKHPGAVAAPTAGLHFDAALLARLAAAGIDRATLTLHVGAGTFQPVRSDDLGAHQMHKERFAVPAETVAAVATTRSNGGRVIAVGTTVARALETSAAQPGGLTAGAGETELFITPGFKFNVVDRLLTNFHLPKSTLLMLVCAFAGQERMLAAYQHAVANGYRFFSYGDACLLTRADMTAGQMV